jgi:O-antigen/teichoic acid export membrane protein
MFGSLTATQVATSTLGFAFWVYAARSLPAAQVGLAAAAIAAMTLVSTFAMLGVGTLLISEVQRRPRSSIPSLFGTGLLIVVTAGLIAGCVAGIVGPLLSSGLRQTGDVPIGFVAFVLGTAAMAAGAVLDEAVLGIRRERVVFLRNTSASIIRIVALVSIVHAGVGDANALLLCWTISILLSLLIALASLRLGRLGPWRVPFRERLDEARANVRHARGHHSLNLILQSSAYLLPVIAALIAHPRGVAYFNSARLVAAALLTIPFMLTIALFASTAGDASRVSERVRLTVPAGLALASLCALGTILFGQTVMQIFGRAYASEGATYLKLLALAGPLLVIKDHYVAIQRVRGALGEAARWVTAGTFVEMGGAILGGALYGLTGLCVGWLVGLTLEVTVMAPRVAIEMGRLR